MRVNVYIDGFNLYYGAVKGTPYRWLNLAEICRLLLPRDEVLQIKYFTALVNPRAIINTHPSQFYSDDNAIPFRAGSCDFVDREICRTEDDPRNHTKVTNSKVSKFQEAPFQCLGR